MEDYVMDVQEGFENIKEHGNSHWGMRSITEKLKCFVEGVREKSPDAVRNATEAAGQAKQQVTSYVENTTIRGMADDFTAIIRRYPMRALLLGLAFGFLMMRRRGD
jgi:hypothetical protein